jgi:hypothetical protein
MDGCSAASPATTAHADVAILIASIQRGVEPPPVAASHKALVSNPKLRATMQSGGPLSYPATASGS